MQNLYDLAPPLYMQYLPSVSVQGGTGIATIIPDPYLQNQWGLGNLHLQALDYLHTDADYQRFKDYFRFVLNPDGTKKYIMDGRYTISVEKDGTKVINYGYKIILHKPNGESRTLIAPNVGNLI